MKKSINFFGMWHGGQIRLQEPLAGRVIPFCLIYGLAPVAARASPDRVEPTAAFRGGSRPIAAAISPACAAHGPISTFAMFCKRRGRLAPASAIRRKQVQIAIWVRCDAVDGARGVVLDPGVVTRAWHPGHGCLGCGEIERRNFLKRDRCALRLAHADRDFGRPHQRQRPARHDGTARTLCRASAQKTLPVRS